ncbi:MAG TPA: YdcF family protein [Candidatus Udaeobacter sp.]|nr:YdcF family protein [Candidatus Udaeobacter sp.]
MNDQVLADAKRLWDYHRLGQPVGEADVILGLGSYDGAVAEHAADLLIAGQGRVIVFSGGITRRRDLLKSPWTRSEAEEFRDIAIRRGAPADRILLEPRSTNTGENFQFSTALLAESGTACSSMIVVSKPYMERRARATGRMHLGALAFTMTSQPCSFKDYCLKRYDPELIINLMVGDFQRIALYPAMGYQAPEEIPAEVNEAFRRLVAAGFDRHLILAQ